MVQIILLVVSTKSFYIFFVISDNSAEALMAYCCRRQKNHRICDVYHHLKTIQFEDGVILLKKYVEKSDDNEVEME